MLCAGSTAPVTKETDFYGVRFFGTFGFPQVSLSLMASGWVPFVFLRVSFDYPRIRSGSKSLFTSSSCRAWQLDVSEIPKNKTRGLLDGPCRGLSIVAGPRSYQWRETALEVFDASCSFNLTNAWTTQVACSQMSSFPFMRLGGIPGRLACKHPPPTPKKDIKKDTLKCVRSLEPAQFADLLLLAFAPFWAALGNSFCPDSWGVQWKTQPLR